MSYRIAICDDSKADAQYIMTLLERGAKQMGIMIRYRSCSLRDIRIILRKDMRWRPFTI